MSQTRKRSMYEAACMTCVGIAYAVPLNYVLISKVQWQSAWSQAFWITVWFTIISFVYKYVIRRLFNWADHKWPSKR